MPLATGVAPYSVSKWLTKVPHPYGLQDARDFVAHSAGRPGTWGIELRGQIVGTMSTETGLGYWLAEPVWGQGIATEAGFGVTDHWFANPSNGDLSAQYFAENAASVAVLRKLGFDHVGEALTLHSLSRKIGVRSRSMRLTRARWQHRQRFPNLETPRLLTRRLETEDAPALSKIAGRLEVARNTSSISSPWPVAEAARRIAVSTFEDRPGFWLALCDRPRQMIGMVGLSPMDEFGVSSVSYLVEKSLWGRGIASEIMAAFVPAAFGAFPLRALVADHFADNPASGAVLRKQGFCSCGHGVGASPARPEPGGLLHYRLERSSFMART